VEGDGRRSGPHETATGPGQGPGRGRHGDQRDHPGERGYLNGRGQLNEPVRYDDPDVRYGDPSAAEGPDRAGVSNGSDLRHGRHRGGRGAPPARATLWGYPGYEEQAPVRRDPRLPYGAPVSSATAEPPDRYDDYWLAGSPPRPPAPSRPLSYPPVIYQESVQIPVPDERHLPAARQGRAIPAVPQNGTVSRPRERVRGMNAALETGVAGVGEMAPARQPARPRQMVLAVVVAIIGLAAGALTYKSLATGSVSFSGEVVPTHVYALGFGAAGTITAVKVDAGDHVSAGQVLATQDNGLARANLQAARDAQAAAAAALYADEHPQQSNVTREQDAVTVAQTSLSGAAARASAADGRDKAIISQRQQAVTLDKAALASQCGTATTSATCQALAAKLSTAQQRLTQAQTAAAADRQAGQQQEQAAQSRLSERQAALQQVQSQASGVSVTLDQARQRLAAAKVTVAQDEIALKGTSVIAPAAGTVGAVSAASGDNITGSSVHNPVLTVDSGPLIVSASLPGTAIGEVRAGQPVTLDIQPLHLSLPGKVVQVNQVASQSQTAVGYTVICQVDAQGTQLMAGMTVNITPQ
jgi:multidrug efflux pump subunit AcrA (membrane-fusion protein)